MRNFRIDQNQFVFCIILCSIVVTAYIFQSYLLLNWDVSWCMHAAESLLSGGTYVKDFFDVNFPLALYLYIPPHLLKKYFAMNIMESSRVYIFFLNTVSVLWSFYFLRKIFQKKLQFAYFLTVLIAFLLFFFPVIHLGQREHLFLIFTFPYFLAVGLLGTNYIGESSIASSKTLTAILLGAYAFIGFSIKPYFFLSFILLEFYIIYLSRNTFSWVRVEVLTIIFLSIIYVFFIVIFYPEFIKTIIPLTLKYFYTDYSSEPWMLLFTQPGFLYAIFAIIMFMVNKNNHSFQALQHVFFIGIVGAIFSYLMQRVSWAYHLLPLLIFSNLLFFCMIMEWIQDIKINPSAFLFTTIFAFLIFLYPAFFVYQQYQLGIIFKKRLQSLIAYMNTNTSHQSVYFLSVTIEDALPAIDYSQSILSSHFAHLPLLPGVLEMQQVEKPFSPDLQKAEDVMTTMIVSDLNNKKPRYIFVDARKYKAYFNNFDYLAHFSKHPEFVNAWKKYHYLQTIEQSMVSNKNIEVLFYHLGKYNEKKINAFIHVNKNSKIIFLIGQGAHRTAYIYKKLRYINALPLRSEEVTLSLDEQQYVDSAKNILLDSHHPLMRPFIQRIIFSAYPFYKLDIYERNSHSREGGIMDS